jgi:hypothetical protein
MGNPCIKLMERIGYCAVYTPVVMLVAFQRSAVVEVVVKRYAHIKVIEQLHADF